MKQHLGPIVVLGNLAICLNCNRPQSSDPCIHDPWIGSWSPDRPRPRSRREPEMKQPTCATHPHVALRCMACTGAKGGVMKSAKKTKAARRNWKQAEVVLFTPNPKEGTT